MTKKRGNQSQWKEQFISALRAEMQAPEEFWLWMQDFTPSQMRLIREVYESVAATARAEGAGHDFRR